MVLGGGCRRCRPAGANVELTLTLQTLARVGMTIWLSLAAAFTVGVGIAWLRGTLFGQQTWPIMLLLLPLGYLVAMAGFAHEAASTRFEVRRMLGFPKARRSRLWSTQ